VNDALRALMITSDLWLTTHFAQIAREVGIEAQVSANNDSVLELTARKYEGVLLDFDVVPDAMDVLTAIRQSRSNENAVVFAVATDASHRHLALDNGANLLLERPLDAKQIRRALYAAYDQMVRERRRYFRCAVQVPVLLTRPNSQADFRCTSINISSSGIALNTPSVFNQGEEVQIVVLLGEAELAVRAMATVVWDDRHGKTGLSFKSCGPQHQTNLDSWLDSHLPFVLGRPLPPLGISN
jgi:DNA-binding response OmpR family regulator